MRDDSEYMTVREAREYLGVNKAKMADLIVREKLETWEDPLDRRVKLLRRADIEVIRARSARPKRLAA